MSAKYTCDMDPCGPPASEAEGGTDGSLPIGWRVANIMVGMAIPAPLAPGEPPPVSPMIEPPLMRVQHICPKHEVPKKMKKLKLGIKE